MHIIYKYVLQILPLNAGILKKFEKKFQNQGNNFGSFLIKQYKIRTNPCGLVRKGLIL